LLLAAFGGKDPVKLSRLNQLIVGIILVFIGFGLFLDALNLIDFNLFSLFPLLIIYLGMRWWSRGRRWLGGIVGGIGVLILLDQWFHIDIGDVIGIAIAVAFINFGWRLIRSRREAPAEQEPASGQRMRIDPGFTKAGDYSHRESRSSLIGDYHLTSGRFELRQLHIWHGVGDVVIDLSRAIILEEEAFLFVNGWVGDVTIYVPADLPAAVSAEVTVGDLEVFGHRQGGLNRRVVMTAEQYDDAARKVKIIVSLIVGDVDVRYI
jgi:lia operon protein LiaF